MQKERPDPIGAFINKKSQSGIAIKRILFVLAVTTYIGYKIYDSYPYDLWLEFNVSYQLAERKKNKSTAPLDLQKLANKKISRLCVQTPYVWQEDFEQRVVGHSVEAFRDVDDQLYVLWLFFTDGSTSQIRIRRWLDMNKAQGSKLCSHTHSLSFAHYSTTIRFLIQENQND